jgi:YesN/AraC family two-component response regulator
VHWGFARHGEEALTVLAEDPDVELLLLDINMPVMDGLALLAELRARRLPVRAVIVSAYGDMTNIRTAMNRGAFDFVTKPVDFADLEVTVDKPLAFTRAERRRQPDISLTRSARRAEASGRPTACTAAAMAAKNPTCLASPRCRATG